MEIPFRAFEASFQDVALYSEIHETLDRQDLTRVPQFMASSCRCCLGVVLKERELAKSSVYVVDYGRKHLILQWIDPVTGKRRSKSSGCTKRREAERAAGELEKQLNELAARDSADGHMEWGYFCERLGEDYLSGTAKATQTKFWTTIKHIDKLIKPRELIDLNSAALSRYVGARRQLVAESTIASELRAIKRMVNWAVESGHLPTASQPKIPRVTRSRDWAKNEMRGRPITDDEFARLLTAVPNVITADCSPSWQHLLHGLWLSGLRISEAVSLRWKPGRHISVSFESDRPVLRIPGTQKSGRTETVPVTPDFADFLKTSAAANSASSPGDASDFVFNPLNPSGQRYAGQSDWVRTIGKIGRAAGVVVEDTTGKHATAHDLRRSFGARWSILVMPAVLQRLMRHATIETTMKYYVGNNLNRTQDAVYEAFAAAKLAESQHNRLHNTIDVD